MSTEKFVHNGLVSQEIPSHHPQGDEDENWETSLRAMSDAQDCESMATARVQRTNLPPAGLRLHPAWQGMSSWSCSAGKRLFDCACVLLVFPLLFLLMLAIGIAVRLTSRGPMLFLQKRVGRYGRTFTIFKFRTMIPVAGARHHPVTTEENQQFTPIGPFLRRWKLDELPQLVNVLLGDMSLVGPRPKIPQHVALDLPCRPGITGMATNVFACEEKVLARIPNDQLNAFYHAVVLPAKRQLDAEYMARATFASDLRLLVNSVLRRWDYAKLEEIIASAVLDHELEMISSQTADPRRPIDCKFTSPSARRSAEAVQDEAFRTRIQRTVDSDRAFGPPVSAGQ